MKAFEKARARDEKYHWRIRDEIAEDYWRDALEWVLEQEYNYDKPEVYDTIRKELEGR